MSTLNMCSRRALGTFSRILYSNNAIHSSSVNTHLPCMSCVILKTALSSPKCSRQLSTTLPCLSSEVDENSDHVALRKRPIFATRTGLRDGHMQKFLEEDTDLSKITEVGEISDQAAHQSRPIIATMKGLMDGQMQKLLEEVTDLSLIIKMTEEGVHNLFVTENNGYDFHYFITYLHKLATIDGIDEDQWFRLLRNFDLKWNDFAADMMYYNREVPEIKDCFSPLVLSLLSRKLVQATRKVMFQRKFDNLLLYQHLEKRVADIILSKVDVLIKEKHPDLEGEVVTLLKDVVKELKTWEYFNPSSAALFIYKAVLIRLIRMGMIEDAFKILTSFEGKVLVAYKTKAMISQIIIEIVQIADDPQDAWSYCDKLVHHLNIKDYYQESDITSEQKMFLCHIVLEFLKAMWERFPPNSVVQVYADIYSLYPSILTLKTFFILARLISKDEVDRDLIQKVMSIEENSVVGDNSSAFTSLFCALIMSKRITDAKAVMKDYNLQTRCSLPIMYEFMYHCVDHKMPLTLLNLYEITVEMDLKKVNRSGMLNAVGTAYARKMDYENAYKILEKLHNEQQTVSQRLVKTLEFAYYKQGSLPELVKHYLGQISLNPRYLSPKKERGNEGEEFLSKDGDFQETT